MADWYNIYGRTGFHAGLGGVRPFGTPNKPTLDISKDDLRDLSRSGSIPEHYVQNVGTDARPRYPNLKQIVLWNEDYSKPLPVEQQHFPLVRRARTSKLATQRIKKREYIKEKLDEEDPVLESKNLDEEREKIGVSARFDPFFKRKTRREALTANPYQTLREQDNLPPPYQNYRLNKQDVRRGPFLAALRTWVSGGPVLERIRAERQAEEQQQREPSVSPYRPSSPPYSASSPPRMQSAEERERERAGWENVRRQRLNVAFRNYADRVRAQEEDAQRPRINRANFQPVFRRNQNREAR